MSLLGVVRLSALGREEQGESPVQTSQGEIAPPLFHPSLGFPNHFHLLWHSSEFVDTDPQTSLLNVGGSFLLKQGPGWNMVQVKEWLVAAPLGLHGTPSL